MIDGKSLRIAARQYAVADDRRAWLELTATLFLYVTGMVTALASIGNWWLMLPGTLLAAAMGLRVYMIQHDCLHGSFFTSLRLNETVGVLLSPISMTPFKATRYIHNQHHSHVGDLDHRDTFEIQTMTLREWEDASPLRRLLYRMYRSPVILVLIGPFLFYLIIRRMPLYGFKTGVGDLVLHNLLLAGYLLLIWSFAGWPGVAVWTASVYSACTFGVLVPYVVHNFENILCGTKPEFDFQTAALKSSSVLDWGPLLDLLLFNIGYHDLHHLNARIPGYRLKDAHRDLEAQGLLDSEKISFLEGLKCFRLKLYDEDRGRMIPFPSQSIQADSAVS